MTRREVLQAIADCEKAGTFDEHIDPINYDNVIPVDEHFRYIHKGLFTSIAYIFMNNLIVKPFTFYTNKVTYHTKIVGKEHLKNLPAAIVTCNHVIMFDCLVVKGAIGQKLHITAASFNNQHGFLGEMMRVGGMMPMSESIKGMRHFSQAISELLAHNKYVLVYPEQAMWWYYQKPRPLKKGAFHFAVENDVPVLPCFITFSPNGQKNDEGLPLYDFTLHIEEPIYADPNRTKRENEELMRLKNYEVWKNVYENFYHKPLTYDSDAPIKV